MAKLKVSELVEATQVNPADSMYIVQGGVSKQISVASFFADISDPTLKGNVIIGDTPQTLSSGGIVSITTPITYLSISGTPDTISIPNGVSGQIKIIVTTLSVGGSYTLTSNIANGSGVRFSSNGHTATLMYTNSKWYMIGGTATVL